MKDNLLCALVALICAFFCGAVLIGVEICDYVPVVIATVIGGGLGAIWKESRRAKGGNDKATVWSYVSYGIGTLIAVIGNCFLAQAQAASIAV